MEKGTTKTGTMQTWNYYLNGETLALQVSTRLGCLGALGV